jgi:type IV pilus assembly protein PilN
MIRINLLPHRELKRAARMRQFNFMLLGVAVVGALTVLLVYTVIAGMQENQDRRNKFLESETAKLDKQIEEIKKLKEQTQALLSRKKVVEALQSNRAQTVHLLDQLARQLPEGIYLKGIKQISAKVSIQGYAQSNARVSTLMRNLEASPWLEAPVLVEIHAATVNGIRANEFSLDVNLTQPKAEDTGAKAAPAGKTKGGKA